MKKTLLSIGLIASLLSTSAFSAAGKIEEQVFIPKYDKDVVKLIESHPALIMDHMSKNGFELFGPTGTKAWLKSANIDFTELEKIHNHTKSSDQASGYPTFEKITKFLKSVAKNYPNIAKLESIGKSVDGKDLWVLKISDNVSVDEVEPEFKYISSMHGDEITGREMMQFLIKDIVEGYGKDKRITDLVNNTELYIMPSMNPDGSKRKQRGNANGYDLNRNFPNWDDKISTTQTRQPETVAVMDFQALRQFSLSANFHGGSVCVNYPWDSTKVRHPFDSLLQDLSTKYSIENRPMYSSREFNNGITNGADWYIVRGGMQDWSYVFHNDLQVTVELSDKKWPSYRKIPSFYKDNKESLLVYAEAIHQGAGFKLNTKTDGSVKISKLFGGTKQAMGSFGFRGGEFFKVLDVGTYEFIVQDNSTNTFKVFETIVEKNKSYTNGNYTQL
jgi:hypothetical protein